MWKALGAYVIRPFTITKPIRIGLSSYCTIFVQNTMFYYLISFQPQLCSSLHKLENADSDVMLLKKLCCACEISVMGIPEK
jgi:hypothetical protein